jgi:Tfp pilus assembly major pilin PilA
MARKGRFTLIELLILVAILGIMAAIIVPALTNRQPPPSAGAPTAEESTAERKARELIASLQARLTPAEGTAWTDGLAAVVLVDVSGSMHDRIKGERRRKIEAARAATLDLIGAFARYAEAHPGLPVKVGVQEFSQRSGEPAAREVIPLAPPNPLTARAAVEGMRTRGGTPIGDAMVEARLALDRSGLARRHLLVVTDGENTDGVDPALVARILERQAEPARAALYFVAFDVDAAAFAGVKNAGGLLLSARSGAELAATFDDLLSDRILVEAPREGVERPAAPVETPRPQ